MKILKVLGVFFLAGCAMESEGGADAGWTVGKYRTSIAHVPGVSGYTQLKSVGVEFRKYEVHHPGGIWKVVLDGGEPPIVISPKGGRSISLASEWYPDEGGADAAAVYAFTKGTETLIILQGTSDVTYEETWVRFSGTEMTGVKRYAEKGEGMGPEMPGVEPEYKVYPPR